MYVSFTATESLEIAIEEQDIPIQHYLRQPQRLVRAIADPKQITPLSEERYRLKMRQLSFLDLYRFQPIVVVQVIATSNGTLAIASESCDLQGLELFQDRFSLDLQGQLVPIRQGKTMYLQGQAALKVSLDLPPLLWLTPKPLLEVTGNGILKSILQRIKQRLLAQLLADYRQWAGQVSERSLQDTASSHEAVLPVR